MKKIQIEEELFYRLYSYFILNHREPLQERIITDMLESKLEKIVRREQYNKNHTGT